MSTVKPTLKEVMDNIATRCFPDPAKKPVDWEFQLYRLVRLGFHSYFKYKIPGMKTEDMTALRRAAKIEKTLDKANGVWIFEGKEINIDIWLEQHYKRYEHLNS